MILILFFDLLLSIFLEKSFFFVKVFIILHSLCSMFDSPSLLRLTIARICFTYLFSADLKLIFQTVLSFNIMYRLYPLIFLAIIYNFTFLLSFARSQRTVQPRASLISAAKLATLMEKTTLTNTCLLIA